APGRGHPRCRAATRAGRSFGGAAHAGVLGRPAAFPRLTRPGHRLVNACALRTEPLYERQHRCSHSRVGAGPAPALFVLHRRELASRELPPTGSPMAFDLTEKRYVKETALEARIARIVEPVANDLGYSLVRVKMLQENGLTLQIMAEDENG